MSNNIEIGNAQTIGMRSFQSNYFMTDIRIDGVFAVMADGLIDSVNGMRAAVLACETANNLFVPDNSQSVFLKCQKIIRERIYKGRMPRVSLGIVWIEKKKLTWKMAGHLKLYLFAKGDLIPIEDRDGTYHIDGNEKVILCSPGIYRSISEAELLTVLRKNIHPYDKAQMILEKVQDKRRKEQENATIVILENGR